MDNRLLYNLLRSQLGQFRGYLNGAKSGSCLHTDRLGSTLAKAVPRVAKNSGPARDPGVASKIALCLGSWVCELPSRCSSVFVVGGETCSNKLCRLGSLVADGFVN